MLNAAIIGVSGYGEIHYQELKRETESGRIRIVAAVVRNQDDNKEKCDWLRSQGTVIFPDYKEMLEEFNGKIDLCCIPTGISTHAEMSIAAMQAGANVLVEKPAAATIQEVMEMQRASEETGKFVAVGFQYIYQPDIRQLKQILIDGVIGKLISLKCHAISSRNTTYYTRNGWAGKLKSGGAWVLDSPYNNAQAHHVNLLCYFAGKEFGTAATLDTIQAELYHANDIENADTACMRIMTDNDLKIYFYATHACASSMGQHYVITGDKGTLTFTMGELEAIVKLDDGTMQSIALLPRNERDKNMFDVILSKLSGNDEVLCDLPLVASQTLFNNGAHESSPIHAIPEDCKTTVTNSENISNVQINDIEPLIITAFEEEKMFSEMGASWAKPGVTFELTGYSSFNGGRSAE
ncbi:Gfo/Idh/MocA family oxidoreductase [Vibrio kyushuensis]|uniref:Gfo/Idh/MocA family protein n=1 Tax=Vibrio kyushuensis TaxID=2910249 RepID=UPI003D0FCDEA